MQLTKQKDTFSNYCKNKEELVLVNSIFSVAKINTDSLIDVLGKWRWMSGVNDNNQNEDELAQQLVLLAKFIGNNYPNITIDEINLAIDLSLTDKLDCDVKTYNTFSPMYVSRILNAYNDYKRRLFIDIKQRKELSESKKELNKVLSPKEKMDNMIELIEYLYNDFKESGEVKDYFNATYNYFRRTKKLSIPKNVTDYAMEYGKIKSTEHINSYFADVIGKEKPNKEDIIKRYARNYCVQEYFKTIELQNIISQVKIEEFTDV